MHNYYIELASLNVSLRSEIIDQLYSELVNVTVTPYNTSKGGECLAIVRGLRAQGQEPSAV